MLLLDPDKKPFLNTICQELQPSNEITLFVVDWRKLSTSDCKAMKKAEVSNSVKHGFHFWSYFCQNIKTFFLPSSLEFFLPLWQQQDFCKKAANFFSSPQNGFPKNGSEGGNWEEPNLPFLLFLCFFPPKIRVCETKKKFSLVSLFVTFESLFYSFTGLPCNCNYRLSWRPRNDIRC